MSANGATAGLPRVALLELYEHHEVVGYLAAVLAGQARLGLYTSTAAWRPIERELGGVFAELRVVPAETTRERAVAGWTAELSGYDLVIVVTLGLPAKLQTALRQIATRRALVVHDARFHFDDAPRLDRRPGSVLRRLRYRLRGDWAARLQTADDWSGLVVGGRAMAEFVAQRWGGNRDSILAVPYAFAEEAQGTLKPLSARVGAAGNALRIGVPGSFDPAVREYGDLRAAVRRLGRSAIWVLPGRARGAGGSAELERLLSAIDAHPTQTYERDRWLTHYDEALSSCDVLVLPLRGVMRYATQFETGGITKVAGAENDQVKAALPALVCAEYAGREELRPCQRAYRGAEQLAELLTSFTPATDCPPVRLEELRGRWGAWLRRLLGD